MDSLELSVHKNDALVVDLRKFSRQLVRELGFMRNTLADSDLAPSAVHAVIEIGLNPGIQAFDLADLLRLDKSNTSRQLAKLESQGFLKREADLRDGRSSRLFLTESGHQLRNKIDQFATDQVSGALRQLLPADQISLIRTLSLYADALANNNRQVKPKVTRIDDLIYQGYRSGCIGDIVSLHARYYAQTSGFGLFFEAKVATELSAFVQTLPSPNKGLWLYLKNGKALASIGIDGEAASGVAHLRWFIVDESLRGTGVGRRLLSIALDFVDRRFKETYLWTFKGLDVARHLYESFGFQLAEEADGEQWGGRVREQKFCRRIG
ncbi:bifunctional helix-turn-helix transcriptional regulator/GNAT family N-acetyltransferase [Aquirhabdus parva]|uniref:MarR family transcriptional regulator n=1 Tax=Aquirhabdus parva TaxID=2283318 RepID=A0A345P4S0_9GAMM|nr:helix-turn-helix domain-containing GNAT family N-acetyltransferase [Aquirhabdus parva]AXI02279.1 MarR family transcriptional regulator [Aquirhabdus parva]